MLVVLCELISFLLLCAARTRIGYFWLLLLLLPLGFVILTVAVRVAPFIVHLAYVSASPALLPNLVSDLIKTATRRGFSVRVALA